MKQPLLKQLGTILFWTAVLTVSLWFFVNNVSGYFTGELEPRKANEKWWLILHFSGALCILVFGPLQFWTWFRNRFWKVHLIAGRFYIGGSLLSALTVFYLLTNYTLPGSIPSLGLLAVIWIFTTLAALRFALKKNFKLHKQFMIRSYICGLAFVFIRLLPRFDDATGWFQFMNNDEVRFTVYEWMCWVYPLMITEFFTGLVSLAEKTSGETVGSGKFHAEFTEGAEEYTSDAVWFSQRRGLVLAIPNCFGDNGFTTS